MSGNDKKAWSGRFQEQTDRMMEEFNASIGFDNRLWREDIIGSMAYAEALARAGIITNEESRNPVRGTAERSG